MLIKEEIYKGKVFDCYFLDLPHDEAMKFISFIHGSNTPVSELNEIINRYLPESLSLVIDLSKYHDNNDPILFASGNGLCIPLSKLSSYGIIARKIEFNKSALLDPEVYSAMVLDGIDGWELREDGIISVHDEKFDDFKNLREVLEKHNRCYDFIERKRGCGESNHWKLYRDGKIYSNMEDNVKALSDCEG